MRRTCLWLRVALTLMFSLMLQTISVAQDEAPITPDDVSSDALVEIAVLEGHSESVNDVAFSPDGRYLVSASDDITVRLWDVESQVEIAAYEHISFAKSVAFSSVVEEGNYIMGSASWDRQVIISDVDEEGVITEREVLEGFTSITEEIAFSPDGTQMAFGIGDGSIHYVNINPAPQGFGAQSAATADLELPSLRPTGLAFSADSRYLLASSGFPDTTIRVWDAKTREEMFALQGHLDTVVDLAAHPQKPEIITSVDSAGQMILWEIEAEQGNILNSQLRTDIWFTEIAFSPDGALLFTTSLDGELLIWDVHTEDDVVLLTEIMIMDTPILAMDIHPEGHLLAFAAEDGTIRLWGLDPS